MRERSDEGVVDGEGVVDVYLDAGDLGGESEEPRESVVGERGGLRGVREGVNLEEDAHERGLEGCVGERGEVIADVRDGGSGLAGVALDRDFGTGEEFRADEAYYRGADGQALMLEMEGAQDGERGRW